MKTDTFFECSECGKRLAKWMGRCPNCGQWNTVEERRARDAKPSAASRSVDSTDGGPVTPVTDIPIDAEPRLKTGMDELDRVLGGGIVRRSVVLIGGDPGIGKSTLLMQGLNSLAVSGNRVLYVSGEESSEQIKLRSERLGIGSRNFLVLVENDLETILHHMNATDSAVRVVDSVQSVFSSGMDSTAGSIAQVRNVASMMLDATKRSDSACFLVGHVTKDGMIAGPKMLEHMVDTVLYFEGERGHPYRILRAVKNRFGAVSEIGVFEMSESGLMEVPNPSEIFLSEKPEGVSGSTVTALIEGTRPILAEVQALVSGPTPGQGRRTCLGTDAQRLALIVAVLEKKLGITLGDQDIFLNAVGGVRASEPATDLAVATALLSSFTERTVQARTVVFGEIGLAGEVRRVSRADARIAEAARLGFNRIIVPKSNAEQLSVPDRASIEAVAHVSELGEKLLE